MIPTVRAWRATHENGSRYIVWGPTKRIALINLRTLGVWGDVKIGRYTAADGRHVPRAMVDPIRA